MKEITYFNGINFDMFGINRDCIAHAHHYPKFYGVQYIHAGYLTLCIDHGVCHNLHGPVAFLTDPHYYYDYYSPVGRTRHHYFICFSGDRVEKYREGGLLQFDLKHPYFPILNSEAFLQDMLKLFLSMERHCNYEESVLNLEHVLLAMHKQKEGQGCKGAYMPALEGLAEKIMLNPEKKWDFQKQAQNMNISQKHFLCLFKKFHGMPPHHFVLRQRLFKAAEMLMLERTSIKEVAFACGFNNEFYFSNLFKKYFEVSPRNYRERFN